ncbi:hypothetical protein StoSoilB22_38680 [Arthrobacter sp. StoSoilB22]|nr:hypothetical protein StoSoilB22_38680 [Arthrobacter sp. StoSoilB22]
MVKSPAAAMAGETPSISEPALTTAASAAAGIRITERLRDGGIRGLTVESSLEPGDFCRRPKRPRDCTADIYSSLASPGLPTLVHTQRCAGQGSSGFGK